MKIELLDWQKKVNQMHFILKESSDSFANLIRRSAIDEVPTLAIEDVEFADNSSALYDEIVAHRLGLVPITTDLKSYTLKEKCSCKGEGCAQCQLKITLKSSKKGLVTAGEAKSQDPKCTFVYGDIPITKLAAGQKIELEATAVLGKGKEHAKWSPGLVYYRKEPTIKFGDKKITEEHKARIAQVCGSIVEIDGKVKVDKEKLFLSQSFDACIGALGEAGAEITTENNYIFTVESWGQLDCREILEQAAESIIQQLDLLEQQFN